MKRELSFLIILAAPIFLLACGHVGTVSQQAQEEQLHGAPTLIVATPMVKMSKKAQVTIMGTGFKPGEEIRLVFTTMDGVQGDIGHALDPQPVVNEIGGWMTTWKCGRYVSKGLIKEGTYTIMATDTDYNFLAHIPVNFYASE
jgi:hypothetical protein